MSKVTKEKKVQQAMTLDEALNSLHSKAISLCLKQENPEKARKWLEIAIATYMHAERVFGPAMSGEVPQDVAPDETPAVEGAESAVIKLTPEEVEKLAEVVADG